MFIHFNLLGHLNCYFYTQSKFKMNVFVVESAVKCS